MGLVLEFRPRVDPKPAPVAHSRVDEAHEAALWMDAAEQWGWVVKDFASEDKELSGFIVLHDAYSETVPLYTLIRDAAGWRLWSKMRRLAEHEQLYDALQSIFPTRFTKQQPARRR